jgi:hypothetical protein
MIILAFIFAQDLRSRSVYWFLFPCLTVLFLVLTLSHFAWQPLLINMGFLILQFLLLTAYFSLKNSQWTNITAGMIGWGDILFLLSAAFYLSVLNFLFFYLASLVCALFLWVAWQAVSAKKDKHIPLAGLQALLLGFFLTAGWWIKPVDLTNDDWLLQLIPK